MWIFSTDAGYKKAGAVVDNDGGNNLVVVVVYKCQSKREGQLDKEVVLVSTITAISAWHCVKGVIFCLLLTLFF